MPFERRRVLIYRKTYPELSTRHRETVCTGGVLLPGGSPIRLYPVPLRLLDRALQYELYDVVDVPVERNRKDPRPESHKIDPGRIERLDRLGTERDWEARREHIFADRSWHFDCLERLKAQQRLDRRSLGVIPVARVDEVELEWRTDEERRDHDKRAKEQASVLEMFEEPTRRHLDFLPFRVRVRWTCGTPGATTVGCPGHSASVLDWGVLELGRREGPEKARAKMEELANLDRYDLHFFVGNFFTHQQTFGIIGMWYPTRRGWKNQLGLWSAK